MNLVLRLCPLGHLVHRYQMVTFNDCEAFAGAESCSACTWQPDDGSGCSSENESVALRSLSSLWLVVNYRRTVVDFTGSA